MPIDPKKDPARCCRPLEIWPGSDRRAWKAALHRGDVLEPSGVGADWAPHSRRKIAKGYGRWLTWLETRGLLDPRVDPAERVTAEHVRDYVVELRALNAPYMQELYQAIGAMAPERDWAWLRRIETRVRHAAVSVRDKRLRVVPSETLFHLGTELMDAANDPETCTPLKRASCYRNGLMIALLAARPLRRRNFARIEIGAHLVREGDAYWLRFDNSETKTGEPIDAPFPDSLVPHLERYLSQYRPFLLQRRCHRGGAFVSSIRRISTHGGAVRISLNACIQLFMSSAEPAPRLRNWSS
jgi:integrase/recombinase XerD